MQAHFFHVYSLFLYGVQNPPGEMQAGGWSRDRPPYLGVQSLVTLEIDRFSVPVQIWWDRYVSAYLQYT